jgi:propanol-preferring alcohol dehydrogenase
MRAFLLKSICRLEDNPAPLELADIPIPIPAENEILIKVSACGVCHTELDEIEGRTPPPKLPVVLGHQVVGRVTGAGKKAKRFKEGNRVGVAWIFSACGKCPFCLSGNENLCPDFKATGRDAHGGYAEFMTVSEDFAYPIPDVFTDAEAAPLLCAGAIGYRSLRLCNLQDGRNLGLTGFGASAHLVLKMARHKYPASKIYVFARSAEERKFARELGATWAGDIEAVGAQRAAPLPLSGSGATPTMELPLLHAIIDTTPVWKPVVEALKNLEPGGRLVINAIRKEDADKAALTQLDYAKHLWLEKEVKSVANVTRRDVAEFLRLAAEIPIKPEVQEYALGEANQSLLELKQKKIRGAKVLTIASC